MARYGGEEFVVLLPNTNAYDILDITGLIRQQILALALPHADAPAGGVTVSLGAAGLVPAV